MSGNEKKLPDNYFFNAECPGNVETKQKMRPKPSDTRRFLLNASGKEHRKQKRFNKKVPGLALCITSK